jgi:hypothetical protein
VRRLGPHQPATQERRAHVSLTVDWKATAGRQTQQHANASADNESAMPATRAQRQRVQQRRHARLPDEIVRHIIDIAGPYCVLVKGGQACSLDIPRTAGRTAKAYLAPVSNNLLRVGVDHTSLENAIADAHDGCTILVEDHIYGVDNVVTLSPIRLQIVGNTKGLYYGTRRTPRGEFEHDTHRASPIIVGSEFPRVDGDERTEDGGVFWVEGAGAQLTLRNLAFIGVSDDWEEVEEDEPVDLGSHDIGIVATQGARVTIENCWFSDFGRMGIRANSGARIEATDCTFNRHYFGALSGGPRSSVVLRNVDFQGANVYAAIADAGGRMDLKACRIRGATHAGIIAKGAGSRIRFDALTQYVSQHDLHDTSSTPWVKRACAIENGSVTFPDEIPGVGEVEGRWVGSHDDYESDVEWESDDDDDDDETRWLTVRDEGWESGHERCMNPGQEGWLPL